MGEVAMVGGRPVYLVGGRALDIVMEDGKPRIACIGGSTHDLKVIAKGAWGYKDLWYARCSKCGVESQVPEYFGEDGSRGD